ncbi:hypothetical protein NMG60_11001313 [Bertholletia excelsa]
MDDERETAYLRRHRRRKSLPISLSCCFSNSGGYPDSSSCSDTEKATPSTRSKAQESPDFRNRCRGFMSRIRGNPRRYSADLSYDPLSYALNFDDGPSDEAYLDDFISRLPLSPPQQRSSVPRLKSVRSISHQNVQSTNSAASPPCSPAAAIGRKISGRPPRSPRSNSSEL